MSISTEEYVVEVMTHVANLVAEFDEIIATVLYQKPFATIDYKSLDRRLEELFKEARDVEKSWQSSKVDLEYFDRLLSDFRASIAAFGNVFDGLKLKADAAGSYSWFSYRKDLKIFNAAYDDYQKSRAAFGATIGQN